MVDVRLRQNAAITHAFIALNLAGYHPFDRQPQPLRRVLLRDLRSVCGGAPVRAFATFLSRRFRTVDEYRIAVAPLFLPMNPWRISVRSIRGWITAIHRDARVRGWISRVYRPHVSRILRRQPEFPTLARRFGNAAAAFFHVPRNRMRADIHLNPLDTPGYGSTYRIGGRPVLSITMLPANRIPRITIQHELLHVACNQRRVMPFHFPRRLPMHRSYRELPRALLEEEYAVRAAVHILLAGERTAIECRRALNTDVAHEFTALPALLRSYSQQQ